MKKVLVLGGAGFIGSHLITELLNSYEFVDVTSIGRGRADINDERFRHTSCDINLSNLNALYEGKSNSMDYEFIFNCAGTGSVGVAHKTPLDDFRNTPLCVYEILEFIRSNSLKSIFIQVSTAAVYGNSDKLPLCVTDFLAPVSVYGVNNEIAEKIVAMYANVFGIQSTIIRLFSVYGAGLNKQLLWDACNKFKVGNSIFFGTGQEIRDWVHVTDAVKTLINAGLHTKKENIPLSIFNGGSGIPRNIDEVISGLAVSYGFEGPISFCGEAKLGDPVGLLADVDNRVNSNEVNFQAGINEFSNWFKALK
jgi:UDP-glucose 4-epimerase